MIVDPPTISWKSCRRLARDDRTLLRSLEDGRIEGLTLNGDTLDIGGGKGFGYVERLQLCGRLDSINIAEALQPTFVADLNAVLPIADGAYDNVICFNTLEHIFDESLILAELLRVLRPGGRFVITVPFLFKRHGNYGDFHRHTAEYWERTLCERGLASKDFEVQPLLWSPLSTALATMLWFRGGLRGRLLKLLVLGMAVIRPSAASSSGLADYALGFYIEGHTPMADDET